MLGTIFYVFQKPEEEEEPEQKGIKQMLELYHDHQ